MGQDGNRFALDEAADAGSEDDEDAEGEEAGDAVDDGGAAEVVVS